MGFYEAEKFAEFINDCKAKYPNVSIRYLAESSPLGTAGGLLIYKEVLLKVKHNKMHSFRICFKDDPDAIFVLNADVCGDLPLAEMARELHRQEDAKCLILTTEATREQSINFGSVMICSNQNIIGFFF